MARTTKGILWMEHEDHGVLPVYERAQKETCEKEGWKVAPGPQGSPGMQKKWKANAADEAGFGANALD